jgi:hypothetical protein
LGLAASHTILQAQEKDLLEGIWNVSVVVTNCTTGAPIREVNSIQLFHRDGTETETANTASRGISQGVWHPTSWNTVDAIYWFYRYKADGTFASIATVTDTITLGEEGKFTSVGVVTDHDATGALISTGCFTHTANRLASIERDRHDSENRR